MAAKCHAVQSKLPCVYMTCVQDAPSSKRSDQPFKVTASDVLQPGLDPEDILSATATEKVDGTCCLVQEYQGVPWLWARLDRRLNKAGERRLRQHQKDVRAWQDSGQTDSPPVFTWDAQKDLKAVPATWIPASGVEVVDGNPQPDAAGHIPGWIPLEKTSRQYCWHLSAVNLDLGLGLVLTPGDRGGELVIRCCPLSELCSKTCELIGTCINANPYGLGTKKQPLHFLVVHGSLPIDCPSPLNGSDMADWLRGEHPTGANRVEGVVWHCPSGALYKLHRHHLNLPWPLKEPRLSHCPVRVQVDSATEVDAPPLFPLLAAVNGCQASQLSELNTLLSDSR